MGMKKAVASLFALVLFVVASSAYGLTFTATHSGDEAGETLKATATFTVSNLDLIITLSNDATFDPNDRQDAPDGLTAQSEVLRLFPNATYLKVNPVVLPVPMAQPSINFSQPTPTPNNVIYVDFKRKCKL